MRIESLAWRVTARIVGWMPAAASLFVIALLILSDSTGFRLGFPLFEPPRVIETVIPPAVGLQAAFAFSPRDEPALEVILAAPRRLIWLLVERLSVIAVRQALAAILGMGIVWAVVGGDWAEAFARWLAPAVLFVGLGVYVTLVTQHAVVSVTTILLAWWAFGFLGDALIDAEIPLLSAFKPVIWLVHVYLQPNARNTTGYLINRAALIVLGSGLLMLAVRHLDNDERLLSGTRRR